MDDECVAYYGPVVDGAPQWEVRREGDWWVVSYQGGPVRMACRELADALERARGWAATVAERRGG